MINKYSLCIGAFLVLMSTACVLDDTTISGVPLLEFSTIQMLADRVGAQEQIFTINSNEDEEIVGANGVSLTIPKDIFRTANGNLVTGMLDITMKEVLTKSDMILSNRPSESDGTLLETAGTFFIRANQGANPLIIEDPLGVKLNMNSNISNPESLGLYYGSSLVDGSVNWMLDSNSEIPLNAGVHSFDLDRMDWTNVAKPLVASDRHKLTINPGATNDQVLDLKGFLIFDDAQTVAKLNRVGDQFSRNDYPSGMTSTVVLIAMDPVNLFLSIVPGVNLTSDKTINASYNVVTEAELKAAIEELD